MSGIAGIIHFDRMPVQAGLIEQMTARLAYRGRDRIGHWQSGPAAFGHCLLQTTVESATERQPVVDADSGRVLVFDGRLDDPQRLARELRLAGATPRGGTDGDLLLDAYDRWGPQLLERVEGDFALVVWDPRRQELFCARDRVGNRPLHYAWTGTTFAFASDVAPLLSLPWIRRELNLGFVAEVLASEWLSLEDTFWNGIQRLPPAHRLLVTERGLRPSRYWRPRLDATLPCRTPEDYADSYRALLSDTVRRLGRSRGPVACEVSGGLDSSALFAVAADLQKRAAWPAPDLHGYTLDFRGAGDADEVGLAQSVARHVGKEVVAVTPTRQTLAWYEAWAQRHGEPAGYPNGVMGLAIREQAALRGANCLMAGVGGDEWLDASPVQYAEAIAEGRWRDLWRTLVNESHAVGAWPASRSLLRYGLGPLLPPGVRGAIQRTRTRATRNADWLTPNLRERLHERRRSRVASREPVRRVEQRVQLLQLDNAYSVLAREAEERLCAACGLELRRPYWDPRLIEFAFATPAHLRNDGHRSKLIHRRAMQGLLPAAVLERSTKADFAVAFRQHGAEIRETLAAASLELADWLAPEALFEVLQDFGNPRLGGAPEWRIWAVFDCYTVRRAMASLS